MCHHNLISCSCCGRQRTKGRPQHPRPVSLPPSSRIPATCTCCRQSHVESPDIHQSIHPRASCLYSMAGLEATYRHTRHLPVVIP
ncbi:hypothetical protein N658DRAFT_25893 [Parathielavia hyrcaniae]|uniref:Uncharacterized protein n=1 Tax=Parathielavia hyrcaniae TaxID=113614 RepID=A0AAN6QE98_9PEZI|nr:hypothetical protein N658DRAFT_25893 [Parathielavia hyrcaniae]